MVDPRIEERLRHALSRCRQELRESLYQVAETVAPEPLERCGWTVWRIRAGAYYADPDEALEDLWLTCQRLGIESV